MVYPWSVVSGGVDSPQSMQQAMDEDPVVQSHYAGLAPENFRPTKLNSPQQGYVSYRIRDRIYWTRRMITLQAGETVLTDGAHLVRGRCGNLISPTPRHPLAPAAAEPPETEMDRPALSTQLQHPPQKSDPPPITVAELRNPRVLADNQEAGSLLPPPDALESMSPIWVAGGGTSSGYAAIGGSRGASEASGGGAIGGSTLSPAVAAVTPSLAPLNPGTPLPASLLFTTFSPPLDSPPPLLTISLTPNVTPWELPATSTAVPPPWPIPITVSSNPGQPASPPFWPPPTTPPPTLTPPSPDNPPSAPPPFTPPPDFPPTTPPRDNEVPEPGTWLFFLFGVTSLALGSLRRRQ